MDSKTYIRFEHVQDGRMTDDLGPFEWFQLTYEGLRVSPNGEPYADYVDGFWYRAEEPHVPYSDIVIWGK